MNKVIVVKSFTLWGIHELSQNPQKYIFKLKKAKSVAIIACDAGVRIISVMARWWIKECIVICLAMHFKVSFFKKMT